MASTTVTTTTSSVGYTNQQYQKYKNGKFGIQETKSEGSIVGDFDTIPLINVARIFSEKLEDRKAVADELREACTRVGFFYVEGHGIPEELIDSVFDVGKKFFALDFEDKMECFINNTPHYRGYTPLYGAGKANSEGLGSTYFSDSRTR